ncbi:MAG TPA: radical SAM family heme chaperone HemW [Verrucomicrobiae bacterium]|jgi:oxygen-independent coproporphyrinogen-3 oxidase|nr:radical SAM family heme chaperone HemW [Verrucomicrobiae bacterium]
MSAGLYISIPFCRSKCTYCNFASGVFSAGQMGRYVDRVGADIAAFPALAGQHGAEIPRHIDSIYLGGGTPSLLPSEELKRLFFILRKEFVILPDAEITVECAPGTLSVPVVETLAACGVNRVSLGVQSFVDQEAASVARLHTREKTLSDIERLRAYGITNINVDLIAGLPHQSRESWAYSLEQTITANVPHVSIYMLEVDEDSRLGRELIAGGTKYHAHFVPDDDATAEFYETACSVLAKAWIHQYEISNFTRAGSGSRHNMKYWTRKPYLGFGVDAHSMLPASEEMRAKGIESWRFATTDSFEQFFISAGTKATPVKIQQAMEESFFLGLRLNRGVSLEQIGRQFGEDAQRYVPVIDDLISSGLLNLSDNMVHLTPRGRLLSNEVFEKFIETAEPAVQGASD